MFRRPNPDEQRRKARHDRVYELHRTARQRIRALTRDERRAARARETELTKKAIAGIRIGGRDVTLPWLSERQSSVLDVITRAGRSNRSREAMLRKRGDAA